MGKSQKISPITAGVTGLVVGAAAGAATAALSDPQTRQRAKQKAAKLKAQAKQGYRQAQDAWKKAEPELRQAGKNAKTTIQSGWLAKSDIDEKSTEDVPEASSKGGEVFRRSAHKVEDTFSNIKDLTNH